LLVKKYHFLYIFFSFLYSLNSFSIGVTEENKEDQTKKREKTGKRKREYEKNIRPVYMEREVREREREGIKRGGK